MVTLYENENEDKEKTSALSTRLEKLVVDKLEETVNLSVVVDDDEACKTPTSKEHRIPDTATCPPAPRKRKASSLINSKYVSNKKNKMVDRFFLSLNFEPVLGLQQVSCNKIPWRSKKKFF